MFHILPLSVPHVRANKLRALAATSAERSALLPEVPTLRQSGIGALKDFEVTTWYGLFGPAGLPREVVAKLNASLGAALKSPANAKRLAEQGLDPAHSTPEALGSKVADELAKWARVVKAANVTIN